MSVLEILFIAVGLSMDAFAVALGVGASPVVRGPRPAFRISFHFGLFQFLMPVVGWTVGSAVQPLIESFDHWIAFGLLFYVGGRMIHAGIFGGEDSGSRHTDPTAGWSLVILSVATSIDAVRPRFAVALGLQATPPTSCGTSTSGAPGRSAAFSSRSQAWPPASSILCFLVPGKSLRREL